MEQAFNILVADDDGDVLAGCMKLFMRDLPQARLSYARTPEECRQRVRQERFNIVLLDIAFAPNDSAGFTLVPEIKAAQPDTKIFMLSGLDDDLTVLRCLELGAVDVKFGRGSAPTGCVL